MAVLKFVQYKTQEKKVTAHCHHLDLTHLYLAEAPGGRDINDVYFSNLLKRRDSMVCKQEILL